MKLINSTYFTKVPRRVETVTLGTLPDPNAKAVNEVIDGYIDSYEPEYLRNLLGEEGSGYVFRYLKDREEPGKDTDEDLEKLLDFLREPCAEYVFFHFLSGTTTQATITGVTANNGGDPHVSPMLKQVQTWNRMVDRHRDLQSWLSKHPRLSGFRIRCEMVEKINRFNL